MCVTYDFMGVWGKAIVQFCELFSDKTSIYWGLQHAVSSNSRQPDAKCLTAIAVFENWARTPIRQYGWVSACFRRKWDCLTYLFIMNSLLLSIYIWLLSGYHVFRHFNRLKIDVCNDWHFVYFPAGAMRLPGGVDDPNKPHFLANGYITQFGLTIKPFPNSDPNTLTHIYGHPTTVTSGMYPPLLFET